MNDLLRFSIVVPTRQRHETLRYALETVLAQDFENYEIVVSDNFSSPETKAVIDSFVSAKIRYFRTEKPLAMSDNWEFAVEKARGEYVTVLGDDDGLLPYALQQLDRVLTQIPVPILQWKQVEYYWPTYVIESRRDRLVVPTQLYNRQIDSAELLKRIVEKDYSFFRDLPMIYNSFVKRDLIDQVRRENGKVFRSMAPDVYSGIVFASRLKWFYSVGRPMSIAGLSGKSNGSALFANQASAVVKDFTDLNQQSGRQLHPLLPPFINNATGILDAFFWGHEHFGEKVPLPSRKQITKWFIEAIMTTDENEYHRLLDLIHKWLEDDPALQQWFDATYAQQKLQPSSHYHPFPLGLNPFQGLVFIDTTHFQVTNVAEVGRLFEAFFHYGPLPLIWQRRDLRDIDGKIPWYYRPWFMKELLFSGIQ